MARAAKLVAGPLIVIVLLLIPFVSNSYWLYLVNLTLIYAVATLGFDILIGWAGQMGLAHAALLGLGAYGSAIATQNGVPLPLALPLVALSAAVVAVLIGFPAMRLKGFFLAIATLAFGFVIVQSLSAATAVTGGGAGMSVPSWSLGNLTGAASTYFLSVAVSVVAFVLGRRALRGRFGRTLLTIRSSEPAALSAGIPTLRYKLTAFGISGGIGAVAGALLAQLQTYIVPSMFGENLLILLLVMVLVGGAGSFWGPVLGATFAVLIVEAFQDLGPYQAVAYGVALMICIGVLPGGIASLPGRVSEMRRRGRVLPTRSVPTATAGGPIMGDAKYADEK